MSRYILGVHSGHDSSACLFRDNKIIIAIEKERLTRVKHDSGEPIECIEYILKAEDLKYSDIDLVVRVNWFNSTELNNDYYTRFSNVIIRYEHHLFHAYAVSITMEKNDIAYVIDGRGCRPIDNNVNDQEDCFETESVYLYNGLKMELLEKRYAKHYPNAYKWGSHMDSVGYAYADVSRLVFKDYNAAGKIMALAAFGKENHRIPKALKYNENSMTISTKWLKFLNSLDYPLDYNSVLAKDISYSLQNEVEIYMQNRVDFLIKKYNCSRIGLSGGVALNCKNNGSLFNKCNLDTLCIFPACGDNGIAVGAAVWAIREIYEDKRTIEWKYDLGKNYGTIINSQMDIEKMAALLHRGEIVGIFENGSEFGPRALCNRSLLALPIRSSIKDYLNSKIKHREEFRPFGGVILEKNLYRLTNERVANDYMLAAVKVKDEIALEIPALVHKDGTIRVQVVREDRKESSIWRILEEMERKYGDIILLNTSFNGKNEPIVETPRDARLSAKNNGIQYILMNGKLERIK